MQKKNNTPTKRKEKNERFIAITRVLHNTIYITCFLWLCAFFIIVSLFLWLIRSPSRCMHFCSLSSYSLLQKTPSAVFLLDTLYTEFFFFSLTCSRCRCCCLSLGITNQVPRTNRPKHITTRTTPNKLHYIGSRWSIKQFVVKRDPSQIIKSKDRASAHKQMALAQLQVSPWNNKNQ